MNNLIHLLFIVSGTLRSNLDPFGLHDDAKLWDALKRSYLVEARKSNSMDLSVEESSSEIHRSSSRFTLDTSIDDEGSNLSVGQVRATVGLCVPRTNKKHYAEVLGVPGKSVGEGFQGFGS